MFGRQSPGGKVHWCMQKVTARRGCASSIQLDVAERFRLLTERPHVISSERLGKPFVVTHAAYLLRSGRALIIHGAKGESGAFDHRDALLVIQSAADMTGSPEQLMWLQI